MDHPASHAHSALLAANASNGVLGVWWFFDVLAAHGPGWSLVPPLFLSASALIGASSGWLDRRQVRRHAEEKFQAEQRLLVLHGFKAGMERLN